MCWYVFLQKQIRDVREHKSQQKGSDDQVSKRLSKVKSHISEFIETLVTPAPSCGMGPPLAILGQYSDS